MVVRRSDARRPGADQADGLLLGDRTEDPPDPDSSIWFIALAKEQLALVTEYRFHRISFGCWLIVKAPCFNGAKINPGAPETIRGHYFDRARPRPVIVSTREKRLNKNKGPGVIPPGPSHFNKEQTPLAILRYQPAVSRRLFRCLWAHLLRSP
jgi:hypothetical protein